MDASTQVPPGYEEPVPLGASRIDIERIAGIVAQRIPYLPGGDLAEVVRKLGGEISPLGWDEWGDPASGSLVVNDKGSFFIYIPSFTGPMHDRFTIAHEIGHYVLHSRLGEKKIVVNRLYGIRSNSLEREANQFAAAFLMPESDFRLAYEEDNSLYSLADRFQVSYLAVQTRMKVLGIFT